MAALTTPPELPYLTRDLPGIGGLIKERLEDFQVEEVPLYQPCGEGTHVYFRLRKAGISTPEATNRIARHMNVRPGDIGVAGLKDARAITSQMMSLEHADVDRLAAFRDPQVSVEVISRHTNKLRPGLLAANRFRIRIRGVGARALDTARAVLDVLGRRGVPNFFGPQRFGARGDTAALGEAMIRNDLVEFTAILLGRPAADDPPDCKAARDAFDNGYLNRALQRWPRHYYNERRSLAAYRKKQRPAAAFAAADKRMKRLYVSAFQSEIFNEIAAARIDSLDRMMAGDLAQKADTGGVFTVEDAVAEQPRADALEIHPTGPIVGFRSSLAGGEPGRMEVEALARHNITQEDFRRVGALKVKGTRRGLRFRLAEPSLTAGADQHGKFVQFTFAAPSGCYATVALREIMKS